MSDEVSQRAPEQQPRSRWLAKAASGIIVAAARRAAGRLQEARRTLEAVLRLLPDDAETRALLADLSSR